MMSVFEAVRTTAKSKVYELHAFPSFLEDAAIALHKTHLYYRSYKQLVFAKQAAANHALGNAHIYGAALQTAADYTSVGYFVDIALVAKCTQDIFDEYRKLGDAYQNLCHAIRFDYPSCHSTSWKRLGPYKVLSPSFHDGWKLRIERLYKQVQLIIHCVLLVFQQIFKLGMCFCDVQLLLSRDPAMRFEACTHLVEEGDVYVKKLQCNINRLNCELDKGSVWVDAVLNKLGKKETSSQIVQKLKTEFNVINEVVQEDRQDVWQAACLTLATFYSPGKIDAMSIATSSGRLPVPKLSEERYPCWGGERSVVHLDNQLQHTPKKEPCKPAEASPWASPIKEIFSLFLESE